MSVMVEHKEEYYLFTKGSPEKVKDLCIEIPDDYLKKLESKSKQGFRLLALAYKKIDKI